MKSLRLLLAGTLGVASALALLSLLRPPIARAEAATHCVAPGIVNCSATIQAAVNAAAPGDTIRVAQGAYSETILLTKTLTLEGGWNTAFTARDWNLYVTTIDAHRAGPVIKIDGAISPTIEGFVLTGGDDTASTLGWGGGIRVYKALPGAGGTTTIRHNVITNNIACQGNCQGEGGGIHVYNSTAIIEYNTILSNTARAGGAGGGQGGGQGGGVKIGFSAEATLTGNTILSNTAVYSTTGNWEGAGGGIYIYGSGITLRGNDLRGNVAARKGPGRGGGVYAAGDLFDNLIISNTASLTGPGYGGGIYANGVHELARNTVQSNLASQSGDSAGGGVYAAQLQLGWDNTIADNAAARGGGVYLGAYSHTELRANLIRQNRATGSTASIDNGGGGIASEDDQAQLLDNQILSNTAVYVGGGLLVSGGQNYLAQANTLQGNTAYLGAGAFVYSSTGVLASNWVMSNTAAGRGGGLYLYSNATARLDANRLLSNTTSGEGGGLCIRGNAAPVTVTNQIIAHNGAASGGGVFIENSLALRFINNTVVENTLGSGKEGLVALNAFNVGITNTIFTGHSVGISVTGGLSITADYNAFYNNATHVSGVGLGAHSLVVPPGFVNQGAGNYHLGLGAPLVDMGYQISFLPTDFEGDPRPHGSGYDIGADEAYRAETYVSALTGHNPTGDGSPTNPFATLTRALTETQSGGTIYVGRGTYFEIITTTRSVHLLGGYLETNWSRNIAAYPTVLDGQGRGTVVSIFGSGVETLVEGFTLTHGEGSVYGGSGGGVAIYNNAVGLLRYNTIAGNHAANGGGGLLLFGSAEVSSVVEANWIFNNVAGGVFTLAEVGAQQGPEPGGGLLVGSAFLLRNNMIYSNTSAVGGDGLALTGGAQGQAYHNTLAGNGRRGIELYSDGTGLDLRNNLIAGHTTGLSATVPSLATWDYNGFYNNTSAYGPGLAGGGHDLYSDPAFINPAAGNYHLSALSPAAGAGQNVGVLTDVDGDPRPMPPGTPPDLGADEVSAGIFLPLVLR